MPARGTVYQWLFQHTAARRRLGKSNDSRKTCGEVSTHSRPKAAGSTVKEFLELFRRFNTQPPEGGWLLSHQTELYPRLVSTHSRPKAAGFQQQFTPICTGIVSTHSRPKAAGAVVLSWLYSLQGFNTQPPEGGWLFNFLFSVFFWCCFNTQPPEGGWF